MPVPVGPWPWPTVRKLKALFVAMGCELRETKSLVVDENGVPRTIPFLYSELTDDFVSLRDYDDDDRVSWLEVENWERRLGVEVPRGEPN